MFPSPVQLLRKLEVWQLCHKMVEGQHLEKGMNNNCYETIKTMKSYHLFIYSNPMVYSDMQSQVSNGKTTKRHLK